MTDQLDRAPRSEIPSTPSGWEASRRDAAAGALSSAGSHRPTNQMAVTFQCPGVADYGRGLNHTTVHNHGCCDRFDLLPERERERTGLRVPVMEEPSMKLDRQRHEPGIELDEPSDDWWQHERHERQREI
jgi:hypothetical protein